MSQLSPAAPNPVQWPEPPPPRVIARAREQVRDAGGPDRRVLVVDDDATGSQAVHDVSILLSFDIDQLAEAFRGRDPALLCSRIRAASTPVTPPG